MKRPETGSKVPAVPGELFTDAAFKATPLIWEFLTSDAYEDGGARERSALSIRVSAEGILIALNDQDVKASAYTQAESLSKALKLLEEALTKGQVQWRPWKGGKRK